MPRIQLDVVRKLSSVSVPMYILSNKLPKRSPIGS